MVGNTIYEIVSTIFLALFNWKIGLITLIGIILNFLRPHLDTEEVRPVRCKTDKLKGTHDHKSYGVHQGNYDHAAFLPRRK